MCLILIINWNTVKATQVLFTKKLLLRDISTVPLYEEPLSHSYLETTPISYQQLGVLLLQPTVIVI